MPGWTISAFGVDVLTLSSVSLVFATYILGLALLVFRFAHRNLAGDRARGRFLAWYLFTVVSVEGLVLSGNFAVLLLCWLGTSTGVHNLLEHYWNRPGARLVAWEKFLVSRFGDVALIAAAVILAVRAGSLNFSDLAQVTWTGPWSLVAALLIVVGALTKSAQVPFHSWLPRTLEAPTAVSALLHAGIINAGGYLLIRLGFLVQTQDGALTLLVALGGLTALWGGFCMLVQADIKRRLAWSTVGQMGFVMVELGLGVPGVALVHIMGHGLYKAHAFLWSGEGNTGKVPTPVRQDRLGRAVGGLLVWAVTGALAALVVQRFWPEHSVLTLVIWSTLLPLVAGGLARGDGLRSWAVGAFVLTVSVPLSWAAALVLGLADSAGTADLAATAGVVVALAFAVSGTLLVFAPWLERSRWYHRLYASALHGFGWGRWPELLAAWVWGSQSKKQPQGVSYVD